MDMADGSYHSLLAPRHMVVRQGKGVDEQRSDDDNRRGKEDTIQYALTDDRLVFLPWGFLHDGVIDGIDSERLTRRTYV